MIMGRTWVPSEGGPGEVEAVDRFGVARSESTDGVVRLALVGEVDLSVGAELTDALLTEIEAEGAAGLIVDLRQVTFLDSTGIGGLVAGMRAAQERNVRYTVANPRGMVRTVLDVTGVLGALTDDDATDGRRG